MTEDAPPAQAKKGGLPFQKGHDPRRTLNGPGRPKGSKHRLSEAFLAKMADKFERDGTKIIATVAREHPVEFLKIVASLMPKTINLADERPDATNPEQRAAILLAGFRTLFESGALSPAALGIGAPRSPDPAGGTGRINGPVIDVSPVPKAT